MHEDMPQPEGTGDRQSRDSEQGVVTGFEDCYHVQSQVTPWPLLTTLKRSSKS
jgi:hypothetical protein